MKQRTLRCVRGLLILSCAFLLCLELINIRSVNLPLDVDNRLDAASPNTTVAKHLSGTKKESRTVEERTRDERSFLTSSEPSQASNASSGFAIAYVVGGCNPKNPVYRNYFYDIAVSVHLMRREKSIADLVVFVQMSFHSKHQELPLEDIALLEKLQARIIYIPKAENESFYRTMLDKFRILSLTEYNRVLFMDGDVMPLGSLDYLYDLSMNGALKENVVMAGKTEPANGGFFMLAPKKNSLKRITKVIQQKEARGAALEYPHFDRTIGWGHNFSDDFYQFIGGARKLKQWKFHGDFADQGLLYQWVKYEEKSVSIVFKSHIEHYGPDESSPNGVEHESDVKLDDILDNNPEVDIPERPCWSIIKPRPCRAPHNSYVHFTGTKKPWLQGPPPDFNGEPLDSPQHFWFKTLYDLKDSLDLNIDFDNWNKKQRPLLGLWPTHRSASKTNFTFTAQV